MSIKLRSVPFAVFVVLPLLLLVSCETMDEPASPTESQRTGFVEIDPGVILDASETTSMQKAFNATAYPSLMGCTIAYDMAHDGGIQRRAAPSSGNGASTLFGDYTSRGATITEITTFNLATLSQYCVLWMEEDWYTALTAAEKTDLFAWVNTGGCVLIHGDNWSEFHADYGSPLKVFGFSYTNTNTSGITSNIGTHVTTTGVNTLYFDAADAILNVPVGATVLAKDPPNTYNLAAVAVIGMGKVAVISDDIFLNNTINNQDNRVLANNLLTWFCGITVNIDIKPMGYPNSINCNNMNGLITVAILSDANFDATMVDHSSVYFEGATEYHVNKKTNVPKRHVEDANMDGLLDLVLHFRMGDTNLDCSSTMGTLTGMLYSGWSINGWDSVNMVP